MKTIKKIILMSVLCTCIILPVGVHANDKVEGKWGGRHERMEKVIQKIYGQLNLTEDQKKQLEANKQKQRDVMKSSYEKMKSQREVLHQELMKLNLDMNKVNSIHVQLKLTQSKMMDARLASILEVRNILTPQQFSQFIALMDEQKSKMWSEESKDEKSK